MTAAKQIDLFDDQVIVPNLKNQIISPGSERKTYFDAPEVDLDAYDNIILFISMGKDSLACYLRLLELGVKPEKIELWHHDVDGFNPDGSHDNCSTLMDWPFIHDYCVKFAEMFGSPLYFSCLQGGFEGEMLKQNSYSKPHIIETPDGYQVLERSHRGSPKTRRKFPQTSASLMTRWCSSALKIDVSRRAINAQDRFLGKRTLCISGERRLESTNRAKYHQFEAHSCDTRMGRKQRHVDVWRTALNMTEEDVWDILKRHGVIAPVPYRLNFPRSSCQFCIFNSPAIWATLHKYWPERTKRIAGYEDEFGTTVSTKRINVIDLGATAGAYDLADTEALVQSNKREYTLPILCDKKDWVLPAGAFGRESCGSL